MPAFKVVCCIGKEKQNPNDRGSASLLCFSFTNTPCIQADAHTHTHEAYHEVPPFRHSSRVEKKKEQERQHYIPTCRTPINGAVLWKVYRHRAGKAISLCSRGKSFKLAPKTGTTSAYISRDSVFPQTHNCTIIKVDADCHLSVSSLGIAQLVFDKSHRISTIYLLCVCTPSPGLCEHPGRDDATTSDDGLHIPDTAFRPTGRDGYEWNVSLGP